MAELFYNTPHQTTDQHRESFSSYRNLEWTDYECGVLDEYSYPTRYLAPLRSVDLQLANAVSLRPKWQRVYFFYYVIKLEKS